MAAIAFFPFDFVGIPSVSCAFTSRKGGVSVPPHDSANLSFDVGDDYHAVSENRQLIHDRLGLTGWCECQQVHGDFIHTDPTPIDTDEESEIEGDGMTTATPGVGLVIKTADCQPILLAHRSGKYVAALHVGWRGNKVKFPTSGVKKFCETYDIKPEDVFAVRGPSLSPAASEFVNFDADFGPGFQRYLDFSTMTMDLWRLTNDQLMKAGVPENQIFGLDQCTKTDAESFFSYRRACASPIRDTGRQAAIIWIKAE
ncbi:MAG: polyphenol oxidase family protein [Pseudodesulfovibrio sp.]